MLFHELAFQAKLYAAKPAERRMFRELSVNQTRPTKELDALAGERAVKLAQYAYEESPFYRDLYSGAGFTHEDLRDPQAFDELPVIDRSMVKEHVDRIRIDRVSDVHGQAALTGGSTGEPLKTWRDLRVPLLPLSWRMYRWWGISPADDVVHIGRWNTSRRTQLSTSLSWWPTRVQLVDASNLQQQTVENLVTSINRRRPALIEGYVGALYEISRYIERSNRTVNSPVAIGATAAPLTAEVRQFVQATFNAPLYDQYRCSEVPWIAGECTRRDGLHIFSDMRRIDVVDGSGTRLPAGTVGDLAITDLANRVFPLIRYRLGDRGALRGRPCPCGLPLPLMDPPDGRTVDMIRLPDRTVIAGGMFSIFSGVPTAVRRFRLHQNADFSIDITAVLGDSSSALADAEQAVANLRDRLRHQVEIRLTAVDDLPYTGGKLKYITSDVQRS